MSCLGENLVAKRCQKRQTRLRVNMKSGNQEGLFELAIQLRTCFLSAVCNTATGYIFLVCLTEI
jgi:hypothetical protein